MAAADTKAASSQNTPRVSARRRWSTKAFRAAAYVVTRFTEEKRACRANRSTACRANSPLCLRRIPSLPCVWFGTRPTCRPMAPPQLAEFGICSERHEGNAGEAEPATPHPRSCHVCSCRVEARPARFRPDRSNPSLVPPFSYVAVHQWDVACSSRLMAWPRLLLRWGRRPQVRWCMDVALRSEEWTWRLGRARPWPGFARLQPAPDPSLTSRPTGTCGALASPRACASLRRASARARSVRRLRFTASKWSIFHLPNRYHAGVAAKRARTAPPVG